MPPVLRQVRGDAESQAGMTLTTCLIARAFPDFSNGRSTGVRRAFFTGATYD